MAIKPSTRSILYNDHDYTTRLGTRLHVQTKTNAKGQTESPKPLIMRTTFLFLHSPFAAMFR